MPSKMLNLLQQASASKEEEKNKGILKERGIHVGVYMFKRMTSSNLETVITSLRSFLIHIWEVYPTTRWRLA